MFSLINNKMPPPFPSLSERKGTLWPSNKNWPGKKLLTSFVFNISISMFPCTWWAKKSNLFLLELIFKRPTTMLLKFLIRRDFRSLWSTNSLLTSAKVGESSKLLYSFFTSYRKSSIFVPNTVKLTSSYPIFHSRYGLGVIYFYSGVFSG